MQEQRKRCPSCSEVKPLADFYIRKSGVDAGRPLARCKPCHRTTGQHGYATKHSRRALERLVERLYNVSPERYRAMRQQQDGRCAICRELPPDGVALQVDHDHACCPGEASCGACVRGLLCGGCNRLLSNARDNVAILRAAIVYLAA
jgi:hypothetical protein